MIFSFHSVLPNPWFLPKKWLIKKCFSILKCNITIFFMSNPIFDLIIEHFSFWRLNTMVIAQKTDELAQINHNWTTKIPVLWRFSNFDRSIFGTHFGIYLKSSNFFRVSKLYPGWFNSHNIFLYFKSFQKFTFFLILNTFK